MIALHFFHPFLFRKLHFLCYKFFHKFGRSWHFLHSFYKRNIDMEHFHDFPWIWYLSLKEYEGKTIFTKWRINFTNLFLFLTWIFLNLFFYFFNFFFFIVFFLCSHFFLLFITLFFFLLTLFFHLIWFK